MRKLLLLVTIILLLIGCSNNTAVVDTPKEYVYSDEWSTELTLERSFTGTSFIRDGIAVATLQSCADGDTATFKTSDGTFRIRFLGIDTPEISSRLDPWGKAAAEYTRERLINASEIVIESQGDRAELDSTGSRYLGFIWVDGSLLNLELVEHGYSKPTGSINLYKDELICAGSNARLAKLKVWGEEDPTYDYSDGTLISIKELNESFDDYCEKKFQVEGVITGLYNNGAFIEADGYAFYMYYGYNEVFSISVGNEVHINSAIISYYNGEPQIINVTKQNVEVLSENNVIEPVLTTIPDIYENNVNLYTVVKLEDITYVSHANSDSGVDLVFEDADNNMIDVRIDNDSPVRNTDGYFIRDGAFFESTTIDLIGNLSKFKSKYQIVLTETNNYILK